MSIGESMHGLSRSPSRPGGGRQYQPPTRRSNASAALHISLRALVRCGLVHFDKHREFDRAVGYGLRPDRYLLAALPLQIDARDIAGPVLERMRELIVSAIELPAADRADIVGLLERIDHLVRICRAFVALDRIREDVHEVI